jgi:hypothetical protein
MKSGPLGHELNQHRDGPVCLRRRHREEAVRDFALHHHAPEIDVWQAVEALDDQRRRDVVRQIRDELSRSRRRLGEIEPQSVAETQLHVRPAGEALGQLRAERRV